jgi:hypothetical protein
MNTKNFEDRVNPSEGVERTIQDTDSPAANSDPVANEVPVMAALIEQTPMGGGTVATVGLMDEAIIREAPLDERISSNNVAEVEAISHETVIGANVGSAVLLNHEESEHFRTLWTEIQGKFVDEPRSAVQQADALVSDVIEKITHMFATEHSSLEGQWKEGKDVSTEDLRQALQHYRSFFNRLVV